MKRSIGIGAGVGVAIGSIIKSILMIAATIVAFGYAIYLATQGRWGAAALVFFVGEPILLTRSRRTSTMSTGTCYAAIDSPTPPA